MNTNSLNILSGVLTNYVNVNKMLPGISIKPNSSLGMAIQRLAAAGLPEDTSETAIVKTTIDKCMANAIDPLYKGEVEVLENIADAYSVQISNAFNILGFIKNSVNEIKDKIEKDIALISSKSEVLVSWGMADKANYKSDFTMMPWVDINDIGTSFFVISQLKPIVSFFEKATGNIEFNNSTFTITYNALSPLYKDKVVDSISGSPEQMERLVVFCQEKTDISRERITQLTTTLMNGEYLSKWVSLMKSNMRIDSVECVTLMSLIADLTAMNKLISAMSTKDCVDAVAFNMDQTAILNENIEFVNPILYLGYIFVQAQRNLFKNRLILDTHVLNPDGLVEFKKAGKDERDVAAFLYSKKMEKVPTQGIYTESVLTSMESVNREIENNKMSLGRLAKLELNEIRRKTFIYHMTNFMETLSTTPKIGNLKSYIKHMSEDYTSLDGNVENAIYGVIINAEYPNTFVQTLYDKLGKAYVETLSSVQEADAAIMTETENVVVISIMVDHILSVLSTVE